MNTAFSPMWRLLPSPAQVASLAWAQDTLKFCKTNQAARWGESKGGRSGLLGLLPDARHPSPAVRQSRPLRPATPSVHVWWAGGPWLWTA